jgi:electron transfer flavoprotein alpha subunit
MANVLAVVEQRDGALRKISHEVVSAARTIAQAVGGETHALLIGGPGIEASATDLGRSGADHVHVAQSDDAAQYAPDAYAATVADVVRGGDWFAVVFAASSTGRDLAPRVAAKLDVPLAADATELEVEGGELIVTRPLYAGRVFGRFRFDAAPRLVSIRPNVFRAHDHGAAGAVAQAAVSGADDRGVRVREVKAASGGALDVGEAPIVVSGGRGMRGPENWNLLESLRDAIGRNAALGASRAVVDAGWRPHAEQVGQTGKTVSPQLYFAVAISGAMQHLAGMRSSGTIVAINKDPDAPIFKVADYGIVGDAHEVVPRLAEEIRKVRGA